MKNRNLAVSFFWLVLNTLVGPYFLLNFDEEQISEFEGCRACN